MSKFTSSVNKMLRRTDHDPQKIIKYMNSSECKIPWPNHHIIEAWKKARIDIDDEQEGGEGG